jgi:EAL domain-containing protein (putative c-di-GMP-specific phosphodiesterase class I)
MLSLKTVAEGVESAAQRSHLQDLGCFLGQGYLFARPVPAADLAGWFRAHENASAEPTAMSGSETERDRLIA